MSHSAPVLIEESLEENWKKALNGAYSSFHIQLKDEKLVEVAAYPGTGNKEEEFKTMISKANENEASFFLFSLAPKQWALITFVPDGVNVKDKMVYASSKGTLKTKLGYQYFTEETHIVQLDELTYDYFKTSQKSVDSRSEFEKMHETILKQEEEEREEREKVAPAIGGYHAVTLPLNPTANEHLQKFKDETVNFVELAISGDKSKVDGISSATVSVSELPKKINASEPRFYLYAYQKVGLPVKSNLFIYSCPDASNAKLRMVYSTAKPTLAKQITQFGINLAQKKIEIREGSELTESALKEESSAKVSGILTGRLQSGSHHDAVPLGGTTKAKNLPTVDAHPIYSLMGGQGSTSKKKIVLPPKGAY